MHSLLLAKDIHTSDEDFFFFLNMCLAKPLKLSLLLLPKFQIPVIDTRNAFYHPADGSVLQTSQ